MLATKPLYPSLLFAVSRSVFPNLSLFSAAAAAASADPARRPAASLDPQMQKLDRMATELISLTKSEARDFEILFRHKLDMKRFVPSIGVRGLDAVSGVAAADPSPDGPAAEAEAAAEKTAFDIRLEKIEANAKLKVTKEVRAFTDLGLKEAKELVEKAPVVLKKGVIKEEAERIAQKLKELGAVVVLE